jgi:hypothetical protein
MKWAEGFMGKSPARRKARPSVQSAVAHFPARATPAKWRQVLIKPPEDLPPFLSLRGVETLYSRHAHPCY